MTAHSNSSDHSSQGHSPNPQAPPLRQPQIELIPMHGAIAANRSTTLDILIKIVPPAVPPSTDRPPLNLGIALDRSGSMAGDKLAYAKEAASYAVENLLPSDRVSIILFDTDVNTLVPSTLATDKATLLRQIRQITAGSSTALHAGWVESGIQVSQYLNPEHLNRVILLSDGLANVGETRPDAIANDVKGLSQRGVSTSTLGIGDDYSEDLLEAMARSGDGNFYHIASPNQLPNIFETELMGLSATLGRKVSLGIQPVGNVVVMDVLNDFDKTNTNRYQLPNLVTGMPIAVVMRLRIPALTQETELCQLRLAWNDPQQAARQVLRTTLKLPVVAPEQLSDFPANPEVQEQVMLLMAARARKEAIGQLDHGQLKRACVTLQDIDVQLQAMPSSPVMDQEIQALKHLRADLLAGNTRSARKKAMSQRFDRQRSRPLKTDDNQ